MIQTNIQVRKIEATEGMWLTQKTPEDGKRQFFTIAYLGIADTPDNYEEWTTEQKDAWEADNPNDSEAQ